MTDRDVIQVVDRTGQSGQVVLPPIDEPNGRVLVRLEDGHGVLVDSALLEARPDGGYTLPFSFDELFHAASKVDSEVVIPVIQEEVAVGKREVERGRFRITKEVSERDVLVVQPLLREHVEIERVPVNQMVETPPQVRYEGDMMIVPVLEEVVVVEIRLMVREELHITRRRDEVHEPQHVTLRREDVRVDPIVDDADAVGSADDLER